MKALVAPPDVFGADPRDSRVSDGKDEPVLPGARTCNRSLHSAKRRSIGYCAGDIAREGGASLLV